MLSWQPNFDQNRQKPHINGHNFSCVRHVDAEFGFDIRLVLYNQRNHLWHSLIKGTKGVSMATNFGNKIVITAFLLEITIM